MAMLPFCGYNMGDYFAHWFKIGEKPDAKLPKIFFVNWFRQDENGKFIWPGYGENSRVLKWVFERCNGSSPAVDTPIGRLPRVEDLDLQGMNLSRAAVEKLLAVDVEGWKREIPNMREYLTFGKRLPAGIKKQVDELEKRLG